MFFGSKSVLILLSGLLALVVNAYDPGEVISLRQELSRIDGMLGGNNKEFGVEFILEKLASEKVPVTLVVDTTVTLRRDAVVPGSVHLEFRRGNLIKLNKFKLAVNGSIAAGPWRIFDMGDVPFEDLALDKHSGKVVGQARLREVFPQWWGADDRLGGDASNGFQAAINFVRQSNFAGVICIEGQFLIRHPLNVTGAAGVQFVGAETKNQKNMIVAHTGGVLFDCSGSRQIGFKGFYIRYYKDLAGYDTPSNCAILFAGGADIPGIAHGSECLYQEISNMYIELWHPDYKGGFGNVGVCGYGLEETTFHSNQFYCDTPIILTSDSGMISGEIKSPYVAFTKAHSVGVNTFSGENMLVRWNNRGYHMYLRGVNTLDLGNIYFGSIIWKGKEGEKALPAMQLSQNCDLITGNIKMENVPGIFDLLNGTRASCFDIRAELGHPGNKLTPDFPVVSMGGNVRLQDWSLRITYPQYEANSPWSPPAKAFFGFSPDPGDMRNLELANIRVYSNQTSTFLPEILPPAMQKKARNVNFYFRNREIRFDSK